jgi:hypothetical protein
MTSRLEIKPRSAFVTIDADPSLRERYRARFEGPAPQVDVRNGTVAVAYDRRLRPFFPRRRGAEITVDPSVPWDVEVRGGVSSLRADFSRVDLESLEIGGGISKSALRLGKPAGSVVVRVKGGASDLRIHRPAGVPVRLRVRGGASRVALDEQRLGAVGGEARLVSADDAGAPDRYTIEIDGGASKLTVDTDAA